MFSMQLSRYYRHSSAFTRAIRKYGYGSIQAARAEARMLASYRSLRGLGENLP